MNVFKSKNEYFFLIYIEYLLKKIKILVYKNKKDLKLWSC